MPAQVMEEGEKYSCVERLQRVGDIKGLGSWGSHILQGGCVLHEPLDICTCGQVGLN